MRNILLLVLFVINILNAQTIEVTPNGLVNAEDINSTYFVINEEGSSGDLQNKVLAYLNSLYKNPKEVLTISPNQIVVNAMASNLFKDPVVNVYYNINIQFKENKVKVDLPILDMHYPLNNGTNRWLYFSIPKRKFLADSYGIWEKNKLSFPKAKTGIEEYFNRFLGNISEVVNSKDDW